MSYREFAPPPDLAPYVECFWTRRSEAAAGRSDRVLPDGCTDIIFDLSGETFPAGVVVGTMTAPLRFENRAADLLAVRFRPGGAASFLRIPARRLTDRRVPLHEIWGNEARRPEGSFAAADPGDRLRQLAAILRSRIIEPSPSTDLATNAVALLRRGIAVERIAAELGVTRQHLSRLFVDRVGIGPKRLGRILRFRKAVRLIAKDRHAGLAGIALSLGWSDQAHMNRDFRELAGSPPAAFRQR
ncbi:MAG: helix-turn-helix domain-containing protein [Thermoanaerobaculia bacterium]